MDPNETWEVWVGSQDPKEFMELSGEVSASRAVALYLNEPPMRHDYQLLPSRARFSLRAALVAHINTVTGERT